MAFQVGDQVRFKNVVAAYGPPDRRGKVGTVVALTKTPFPSPRIDVLFDGETDVHRGSEAALFDLAE